MKIICTNIIRQRIFFERIYSSRSIWTKISLHENFLKENFLDEIKANYGIWHLDVCHSRCQTSTQYVRLWPSEFAILLTCTSISHTHLIAKHIEIKCLAHLFVLLPQHLPFLHDGLELGHGVGLTRLGKGRELWAKSLGSGKGLLQLLLRSEADICKEIKTSNPFSTLSPLQLDMDGCQALNNTDQPWKEGKLQRYAFKGEQLL